MTEFVNHHLETPLDQIAIRGKCFQPSGTFVEFPIEDVETSIPERFEKIVQLYPDRVAVKAEDRSITYIELNALANRIARSVLSQRSVEAVPVGILLEKGIEQTAAMLGVLKAGKFFVLLDPSFPQTRIATILENSGTRLMIADNRNAATMESSSEKFKYIMFESIDHRSSVQDPRLVIQPSEFAYLVYTSGSTGRPKGVVQTHRNLLHRVMLHTRENAVGVQDRMALLPAGTSNAITNTFNALLTGATLCPFDVKKKGVRCLAEWLQGEKISVCLISATLFRSLCHSLDATWTFPDIRFLRIRSESAYKSDVELFRKHFLPSCILVNGLSSSETGPICSYFIRHDTETSSNDLPVGYALEGKEILLFDDEGRKIGPNEIGEIVVRSPYLSPGYWRWPELTEAKFKADPYGSDRRRYYTGDLGMMLTDGCLIHRGRKDFRVKIRGYGVDLAEVEQALREHPAVKEAAVVSIGSGSGEHHLSAYITTADHSKMNVSELRSFLSTKLADYMVPSVFVPLDAMPLTPNGKIDRKALPEPGKARPQLNVMYVGPRSEAERQLVPIWAEVLSIDKVGIHDNFFELGGHSLAASQVISRVIQTFQLELPIMALFDSPTVAEMATIITQNQTMRVNDAELAQMLREVEAMTELEAQKQLAGGSPRTLSNK